ncbi:uncharacterized protein LOC135400661 [Ornithodoros turicata]|uniref:uncharacterized protein LOC135400661 n=1 Tax=Ornithodoros turicata TaxID=34597 RepID=UPI0031396E45
MNRLTGTIFGFCLLVLKAILYIAAQPAETGMDWKKCGKVLVDFLADSETLLKFTTRDYKETTNGNRLYLEFGVLFGFNDMTLKDADISLVEQTVVLMVIFDVRELELRSFNNFQSAEGVQNSLHLSVSARNVRYTMGLNYNVSDMNTYDCRYVEMDKPEVRMEEDVGSYESVIARMATDTFDEVVSELVTKKMIRAVDNPDLHEALDSAGCS